MGHVTREPEDVHGCRVTVANGPPRALGLGPCAPLRGDVAKRTPRSTSTKATRSGGRKQRERKVGVNTNGHGVFGQVLMQLRGSAMLFGGKQKPWRLGGLAVQWSAMGTKQETSGGHHCSTAREAIPQEHASAVTCGTSLKVAETSELNSVHCGLRWPGDVGAPPC